MDTITFITVPYEAQIKGVEVTKENSNKRIYTMSYIFPFPWPFNSYNTEKKSYRKRNFLEHLTPSPTQKYSSTDNFSFVTSQSIELGLMTVGKVNSANLGYVENTP